MSVELRADAADSASILSDVGVRFIERMTVFAMCLLGVQTRGSEAATDIVANGDCFQVSRVDACPVSTKVVDAQFTYWPMQLFKEPAVSEPVATLEPEDTVTVQVDLSSPQPATTFSDHLIHFWPETLFGIGTWVISRSKAALARVVACTKTVAEREAVTVADLAALTALWFEAFQEARPSRSLVVSTAQAASPYGSVAPRHQAHIHRRSVYYQPS